MSFVHPDKSVDYYVFLGSDEFAVLFSKPTDDGDDHETITVSWHGAFGFQSGSNDISTSDVAGDNNGEWRFNVRQAKNGNLYDIAQAQWFIDPITGSIETSEDDKDSRSSDPVGNFYNMMDTPSQVGSDWAVSYGFYDSGSGMGSLTNHDQNYVYVTPDMSNWMADAAKANTSLSLAALSSFVLPGAHDAGTYDLTAVTQAFSNPATAKAMGRLIEQMAALRFGAAVVSTIASMVIHDTDASIRLVQDLAVTQKDNVSRMLDLGVRYFDFRPGYCVQELGLSDIYHQHAVIPGVKYADFLTDIFKWLGDHPGEIVVVSANFQGFDVGEALLMQPSVDTLHQIAAQAQTDGCAGKAMIWMGGLSDLGRSYQDLVGANMRLIFLNQIAPSPAAGQSRGTDNTLKYDSYEPTAYRTTNVQPILGALAGMKASGQAGFDYTVMQLQGTAQGTSDNVEGTVADFSWSGSPLMSTKANFDSQTYPWLLANLRTNLGKGQLTVLLNDFADNALAMYAKKIMTG